MHRQVRGRWHSPDPLDPEETLKSPLPGTEEGVIVLVRVTGQQFGTVVIRPFHQQSPHTHNVYR